MAKVLVLLAAVCFGTTGTAQALGPDAAPAGVGAARIVIGGALLLLVARAVPAAAARWPRRELARDRRGHRHLPAVLLRRRRPHGRRGRHRRRARLRARARRPRRPAVRRRAAHGPLGGRDRARVHGRVPARARQRRRRFRRSGRHHAGRGVRLRLRDLHGPRQAPAGAGPRAGARDGRVVRARRPAAPARPRDLRSRLARLARRRRDGALPRRDPDRARVRALRPRAAPPDARGRRRR